MSSVLRQCKHRLDYSKQTVIDRELKNVNNVLDQLVNENRSLQIRFDQLDERYQQWIDDERIYLLKRIDKLEKENQLYQTSQIQNNKSLQSITNLILQILFTQQELRKQYTERQNANDVVQWRKKQPQHSTNPQQTRSVSCHSSWNDRQSTRNDQSIWFHQVKEQDQKTSNSPSEFNNHPSILATNKSSTALSNKIYYVINHEKMPPKSTRDNRRSTGINIVPMEESTIILPNHRKQPSTITSNKNPIQTGQKLSSRPSPIVKSTPPTTTTTTKSPRIPTITLRPPITNTRPHPSPTNPKSIPSSLAPNKPPRPRYTLSKPSESPRPRSVQIIPPKSTTASPPKLIKTRIPILPQQQSVRVTDLDTIINEQQNSNRLKFSPKPSIITPSTLIHPRLFSKETMKIVRPVQSEELKLFSCHLTPEKTCPTNDSLSTLTPSSIDSIIDHKHLEKKNENTPSSSNISGVVQDFSDDSLNEHYHIQKLLQQRKNISSDSDSLRTKSTSSTLVHRLVFPARLGRLIFYRRILSDSDLYQKNCSKENEIIHHVYHLDTVRDYSMEFYMLSTYASDSQLRAWMDGDDDEIIDRLNENRFLSSDDVLKRRNSSDSLIQTEELDWYSELELLNLTKEDSDQVPSSSSEFNIGEFLALQQSLTGSSNSPDLSSVSWTIPAGGSNQLHSTPLPSDMFDHSNSILREILNHSWTEHVSQSNSFQHETGIEQLENNSSSSMISEQFQPDFYYLCPITKTTSFTKID